MADHPIYGLERNTQANLLSEALLREFMHKRKFLSTLKQFDQENPRNEMTVSSRHVMLDLMLMLKTMPQMKTQGIDSIVEAICEHRLGKRARAAEAAAVAEHQQHQDDEEGADDEHHDEGAASAAEDQKRVAELLSQLQKEAADLEEQVKQRRNETEAARRRMAQREEALGQAVKEAAEQVALVEKSSKKKKKASTGDGAVAAKKKKKHGSKADGSLSPSSPSDAQLQQQQTMSLDELLESNESHTAVAARRSFQKNHQHPGGNGDHGDADHHHQHHHRHHHQHPHDDDADNNKSGADESRTTSSSSSPKNAKKSVLVDLGREAESEEEGSTSDEDDDHDHRHHHHHHHHDDDEEEVDDYAAGLRAIREEEAAGGLKRKMSLRDDDPDDHVDHHRLHLSASAFDANNNNNNNNRPSPVVASSTPLSATASPASSPASAVPAPTPADNQLGIDAATSIMTLLTGAKHNKRIPTSFFQPILRWTKKSQQQQQQQQQQQGQRPYCLIQKMGGPCGAIAALQARVIAQWFFHGKTGGSNAAGDDALVGGISAIIQDILAARAKPKAPCVFVAPPPASAGAEQATLDTMQKQINWLACCDVISVSPPSSSASSLFPASQLLEKWTTSRWGLLCFIISCVLTRARDDGRHDNTNNSASSAGSSAGLPFVGVHEVIVKHMDEPRPLIVEHGYCSQELVNLMVCGWATSHVHDGVIHIDTDIALKGFITSPPALSSLEVGFLSMMEVRKLLSVGKLGKDPRLPIWIVFNESHYTVLFAREKLPPSSALGDDDDHHRHHHADDAEFDVWYFDPQCPEEEYRLTLTMSSMPLPAKKANALLSFVDQIIRTRPAWAHARVNWNGADPLL